MISRLHGILTIGIGAVILAAGVCAQTSDDQEPANRKTPETVIVTGQKSAQDVDTIVSQFIDVHAAKNRKTGQYMREARPICPVTLGLPPAFNAFVTARVRAVAVQVGAKTADPATCVPNVEILFTSEPEAVVKSLAQRTNGVILGTHYVHEAQRLMTITHPIQGWYVTGSRYDESSIAPVSTVDRQGNSKPADDKQPAVDDAYWNAPERTLLGSKIPMRRVSAIANVLIVADATKVAGEEIGPIADYIAMLSLSQPNSLDACNAFPSILDLMASGCDGHAKPKALTGSDMAYLKGLYADDLGAVNVSTQKDNIASGMKGNLGDQRPSKPAPLP
jgi:hypothetical protein